MSTRITSASNSRQVKDRLIHLLFHDKSTGSSNCDNVATRSNSIKLCNLVNVSDTTSNVNIANLNTSQIKYNASRVYTYQELKLAYLEKIQSIHPDKSYHTTTNASTNSHTNTNTDLFIQLQEAWKQYDKLYQSSKKGKGEIIDGRSRLVQEDFTMFGVGCSFSDNPQERDQRNEIMDQAGRGFFTAGFIQTCSNTLDATTSKTKTKDDAETQVKTDKYDYSTMTRIKGTSILKRKTLIDHLLSPSKK